MDSAPRGLATAALIVAACAGAPRGAVTSVGPVARGVPVGELPAALPAGGEVTDHGQTGAVARVVRGARRERVAELYQQYLRAVAARDADALRQLFDDPVLDVDGGEVRTRESVLRQLDAFMNQNEPGALLQALGATRAQVSSIADLRRRGRSPPSAMRADDWLVEAPGRQFAIVPLAAPLPRSLLVRWVAELPLIVGAAMPRSSR